MSLARFKKYYKFPLVAVEPYYSKWFGQDTSMALDFPHEMLGLSNVFYTTDEDRKKLISQINGDTEENRFIEKLRYEGESSTIYLEHAGEDLVFIIVRGWGNLTGPGGHNLPEEKAAEIQDEFGEYIIKRLTADGT